MGAMVGLAPAAHVDRGGHLVLTSVRPAHLKLELQPVASTRRLNNSQEENHVCPGLRPCEDRMLRFPIPLRGGSF